MGFQQLDWHFWFFKYGVRFIPVSRSDTSVGFHSYCTASKLPLFLFYLYLSSIVVRFLSCRFNIKLRVVERAKKIQNMDEKQINDLAFELEDDDDEKDKTAKEEAAKKLQKKKNAIATRLEHEKRKEEKVALAKSKGKKKSDDDDDDVDVSMFAKSGKTKKN
jgi:hypothetical protein